MVGSNNPICRGSTVTQMITFVFLHSLSGNMMSDEGGRAIAEALKVNQSLTTLK